MSIVDAAVVQNERRPWGFWATLGLLLLVLAAYFLVQIIVAVVFFIVTPGPESPEAGAGPGLVLCVATWISNLLCLALVALVAGGRGFSRVEYLALRKVRWRTLVRWIGGVIVFAGISDALTYLLGYDVVSQSVCDVYTSSKWPLLLWSVVLLAAPLFEEVFFRGFVFRGIQASRLGSAGAIVVTSLVWTGIHLQYDLHELLVVFAGGILLGIARVRTGSVLATIAMHSTMNLIATLEVWWYLNS